MTRPHMAAAIYPAPNLERFIKPLRDDLTQVGCDVFSCRGIKQGVSGPTSALDSKLKLRGT